MAEKYNTSNRFKSAFTHFQTENVYQWTFQKFGSCKFWTRCGYDGPWFMKKIKTQGFIHEWYTMGDKRTSDQHIVDP